MDPARIARSVFRVYVGFALLDAASSLLALALARYAMGATFAAFGVACSLAAWTVSREMRGGAGG